MNRVSSVGGVLVPIRRGDKSMLVATRVLFRVFARKLVRSLRNGFQGWDRWWREQTLTAIEMERVRLREQARLHQHLPMTKGYGQF